MMNMTNQAATKDFFEKTIDIIAKNTSFSYSTIALNGIKDRLNEEFVFLKNIHIKGKSVDVDKSINDIGKNELRDFFRKVVNIIGPNYLKMLLAQSLNKKALIYLENIGLRFD